MVDTVVGLSMMMMMMMMSVSLWEERGMEEYK